MLPYRAVTKLIHRLNKSALNPGFFGTVARVVHHLVLCLGPGAMEVPRGLHGAHHIIPSLHNGARNVADLVNILQNEIIRVKETAVDKVVALDAGKRKGPFILRRPGNVRWREWCSRGPCEHLRLENKSSSHVHSNTYKGQRRASRWHTPRWPRLWRRPSSPPACPA